MRHSARRRQEHIWSAWARDGEGIPVLSTAGAVCLFTGAFEHPALLRGTSPAAAPHWDQSLQDLICQMQDISSQIHHAAGSGMWVLEEGQATALRWERVRPRRRREGVA